jgi:hypothetical protein
VADLVDVVWKKSMWPDEWLGPMTGTLTFGYHVDGPVTLGSLGPISGDATVHVKNNPLVRHSSRKYQKGDPLIHAYLYASVFGKKSPALVIDENYNGLAAMAGGSPGDKGVDPVICTASNGCPPEDPDCGKS